MTTAQKKLKKYLIDIDEGGETLTDWTEVSRVEASSAKAAVTRAKKLLKAKYPQLDFTKAKKWRARLDPKQTGPVLSEATQPKLLRMRKKPSHRRLMR